MRKLSLSEIIDPDEFKDLFLAIAVLGFAFSFRSWGSGTFDASAGFQSWLIMSFLVAISFAAHEVAHRMLAARYDAKIRFKTWWVLIGATILLVFLTNGWFVFAAVGAISVSGIQYQRMGHTRPHLGPYERAKIAVSGPLANLALAMLASAMFAKTGSDIWQTLMVINILIALFNLFPFFRILPARFGYRAAQTSRIIWKAKSFIFKEDIPYIEGELAFFGSKPLWVFTFVFALITSLVLYLYGGILSSIILAFLLATATYIAWHYYMEPWSYETSRKKRPGQ